jgi:C-terminal processing protease CtpA/Prc
MKNASIFVLLTLFVVPAYLPGQDVDFERAQYRQMLYSVRKDVEKFYFDPNYKGIDLNAKYDEAQKNLEAATSVNDLSAAVAQFLLDFDDSHLYFHPPPRLKSVDYGFYFRMYGDKCLVRKVDPNSDAHSKGLRAGDHIRSMGGYSINRKSITTTRYYFNELNPQASLVLEIVKPNGARMLFAVTPKITLLPKVARPDMNQFVRDMENYMRDTTRQYFYDGFESVFIWKMPAFSIDRYDVDKIMNRVKKHPALILDMRGNRGGDAEAALRLISNMFDRDIKVADEKRRKESRELFAKSRGKDAFQGKIIVLIDSDSASGAEIFARIIQIEARGTVIGDRSAGAVMKARLIGHELGSQFTTYYAVSVPVAHLVMTDGKTLEKIGVTPDIVMIPSQTDLATGRDIVLAEALRISE